MRDIERLAGVIETRENYQPVQTFTVTDDHLALLRRAYVRWEDCEFGAPAIDCKRPYGNSDGYRDIAEILDEYGAESPCEALYNGGEFSDEQYQRFERLHAGTMFALQIVLHTGAFKAGSYRKVGYGGKWEPA